MKAVTMANYFPVYFSWPRGDDDDPFMIAVGEAFGEKVWTDGHVMLIGDPPHPSNRDGLDFEKGTRPALRDTVKKLTPLGLCDTGVYYAVLFEEGGPVIQAKYFNLIRERWPDVEFYGDGARESVVCKVGAKIVAMVMPIRQDASREWREAICQSVKSAEEQAATETIQASDTVDHPATGVKVQE